MEYLATLNEKQLEAATCTEGYLRVIAGAGSGKTKLLVSRYAFLVKECGISSGNILCVTFTNKAANEMKRRIRAIIGDENDTSLICTYHGFCVKVLKEDVEKIFYPREFQIIDTAMQKSLLGEIYRKFELKLDHGSFEKIIRLIAKKKANRRYIQKICCTEKCQILDKIETLDDNIVEEFLQKQKQIYALDFNDLMYFTLDIFERCPSVLEKWQDRLNYIQVDEFQDSSATEMQLIDMLSSKHNNLMIVGDPDQNIYEWRGSDVKLLVDFDKAHTPTKTLFLNQNYRSTPQILKCANTLIDNNRYRLKKDLFTKREGGAHVYHYHTKNEYAEVDKIIENIHRLKQKQGCNYTDFAVLYRSSFLSRVIEKKFTENAIPYEIFGGVKFFQRMEIQDIVAYLRLVAFDDDLSFRRIINTPRRRFGRTKLQYLSEIKGDKSFFEALKENIGDAAFKNSGAQEFIRFIESVRAQAGKIPLAEIVEKVCEGSGYEKYIRELGDMERFENLSEFKRISFEYEKNYGEEVSLGEFINHISLQAEDEGEDSPDTVKLMTIHSAKGLEFPNVFIVGFSEGIFPSAKTLEERQELGLEEERRLCYVAITRAEKRLFLLDSEGYTQNGKQKYPSRFLLEIGEDNYIREGKIPKDLFKETKRIAGKMNKEYEKTHLTSGSEVEHHIFGKGKIIRHDKNKNGYVIKFDKFSSERVLSADYFNREKQGADTVTAVKKEEEKPVVEKSMDDYVAKDEKIVAEAITKPGGGSSPGEGNPPFEPHTKYLNEPPSENGWVCVGITDLGFPSGMCQVCGQQNVRYIHHMHHPEFGDVDMGCVCAGKAEGNMERARNRENEYKKEQSRRENFMKRKWKKSKNNNSYTKIKNHLIVLYYSEKNKNWKYSIDNVFCREVYLTREEAISGAFEALEKIRTSE